MERNREEKRVLGKSWWISDRSNYNRHSIRTLASLDPTEPKRCKEEKYRDDDRNV